MTTPVEPCAKFQPLCDHANRLFRHFYIPYQQLSIDESSVGTKSRTSLMQYLPKKQHHRWGIKLWVLCDSITNYCLGFYLYKGAKCGDEERGIIKESGLSYLVVTKLMAVGNYLNKWYHLFVDNFFSSVPLAKHLYLLGTYITGTIRINRKYLPQAIKTKFDVGVLKFFKNSFLLLCGFREKKS